MKTILGAVLTFATLVKVPTHPGKPGDIFFNHGKHMENERQSKMVQEKLEFP